MPEIIKRPVPLTVEEILGILTSHSEWIDRHTQAIEALLKHCQEMTEGINFIIESVIQERRDGIKFRKSYRVKDLKNIVRDLEETQGKATYTYEKLMEHLRPPERKDEYK